MCNGPGDLCPVFTSTLPTVLNVTKIDNLMIAWGLWVMSMVYWFNICVRQYTKASIWCQSKHCSDISRFTVVTCFCLALTKHPVNVVLIPTQRFLQCSHIWHFKHPGCVFILLEIWQSMILIKWWFSWSQMKFVWFLDFIDASSSIPSPALSHLLSIFYFLSVLVTAVWSAILPIMYILHCLYVTLKSILFTTVPLRYLTNFLWSYFIPFLYMLVPPWALISNTSWNGVVGFVSGKHSRPWSI